MKVWYNLSAIKSFKDTLQKYTMYHLEVLLSVYFAVRFARGCTNDFDSILKIFKSLQNFWRRVTDITSFRKRLESSLGHTLNFCLNLVQYCFQNIYQKESLTWSSTVILSQTKEGQSRSEFHLVGLENSETTSTSSV